MPESIRTGTGVIGCNFFDVDLLELRCKPLLLGRLIDFNYAIHSQPFPMQGNLHLLP